MTKAYETIIGEEMIREKLQLPFQQRNKESLSETEKWEDRIKRNTFHRM